MKKNVKEDNREKRLFSSLDWLIFLLATASLIIMVLLYFSVAPQIRGPYGALYEFLQALLVNLIPIPLLFVITYVVYRRIQTIRDERDREVLVKTIASSLAEELEQREARRVLLTTSPQEKKRYIENAADLWLVGTALNKTINDSFSLLRSKLQQGSHLRVLLIDPQSASVEYAAMRKVKDTEPHEMEHYIRLTLSTLCSMKREYPDKLTIRTIDYPLAFGAIATDIENRAGMIFVEYYLYRTAREGLHLALRPEDVPWYSHFSEQIMQLWSVALEWDCSHGTQQIE